LIITIKFAKSSESNYTEGANYHLHKCTLHAVNNGILGRNRGNAMSQRQQLERIMEIDRRIRAGQYPNARTVADALEVSVRVVYQDKAFMTDRLGALIRFDRRRGGWYYTDATWTLPSMFATEGEVFAFFLGIELARRYLGTAFEKPLKTAIDRLAVCLGERVRVDLEGLRAAYNFAAPMVPEVDPQLLLALDRSVRERRKVRIDYYSASSGERNERAVSPHLLHNNRGDWYLIAHDGLRNEMRMFHLGRVEGWEVLAEQFERDAAFRPEEWLSEAFQSFRGGEEKRIVIRFDAYQARWIRERRWHETQEPLEELPGGGVILRFRTGGLDAVKRWVMQYGSHTEVLEPEELREMVLNEFRKAFERYG
jgi:predicted DNA-binding transcriptional regulator YafY